MFSIDVLSVFFAASIMLSLAPGPDNIFVLMQSALRGRAAGLLVTLGLCTGLIVHTLVVAFGAGMLFQQSSLAFNLLKLSGALYLLYLAWQAFRASPHDLSEPGGRLLSYRQLYLRGLLMNLSNPKVAMFFLAFLPPFTDASQGAVEVQMLLLGGIFIAAAFLVFASISWASAFLGQFLRHSHRAQGIINKIAGTVFVLFALSLLLVKF